MPPRAVEARRIDDLLARVRRIEIRARRLVASTVIGDYRSVFRGRGIEFAEVRRYEPGDDVRSIDWNVTARMNAPYVKTYIEERELTVLLAVDLSASSAFGSTGTSKRELAAEVAATLAFAAINSGDRIGLLTFTDRIEEYVPPAGGRTHVLRLIRELLFAEPKGSRTNIAGALSYLARVTRRRAIIFVLSDFFDTGYDAQLRALAARHEVVAFSLSDRRDAELPDVGLLEVRDAETGARSVLDTSSAAVRASYVSRARQLRDRRRRTLGAAGVDEVRLSTGSSFVAPLLQFFRRREHQR